MYISRETQGNICCERQYATVSGEVRVLCGVIHE